MTRGRSAGPGTALAIALALGLASCLGGTGTDTENGFEVTARVLDLEGRPAAGLALEARPWDAEPGSSAPAAETDSAADSALPASARTDSLGVARFRVAGRGAHVVLGARGDSVLLLLAFMPHSSDTVELRMESRVRVAGTVRLFSAFRPDTGTVVVRGTSLTAPVSPGGGFDLGPLPRGVLELGVGARFDARPAREAFVKIARAATPLVDPRFEIDSLLLPDGGANFTLFKASPEGTDLCLDADDSRLQGVTVKGSLSSRADVRRAAGWACGSRTGARIRVEAADAEGRVTGRLGEFITPDRSVRAAWGGQASAPPDPLRLIAPADCRLAGDRPVYNALFVAKADGAVVDLHVDDLSGAPACRLLTPP